MFRKETWYGEQADRNSAYFWVPLIAAHSGMRLEEIVRLRPMHDVTEKCGIPCFSIQPHPDGWNPKTEAGRRLVPIHSFLIELGFLDFVGSRTTEPYLFNDLKSGGPDGKRGYQFSREFSRAKIKLGVAKKTTFHSFRHSARTMLTNTEVELFRDAWIDAVMGHDAEEGQSEGVQTYTKRIDIENLRKVVEHIRPLIDLRGLLPVQNH